MVSKRLGLTGNFQKLSISAGYCHDGKNVSIRGYVFLQIYKHKWNLRWNGNR